MKHLALVIFLIAVTSPVVWVVSAAALLMFAVASVRGKRIAWKVFGVGAVLICVVSTTSVLWQLLGFEDLVFNMASLLTHKVRIYPVACEGKVVGDKLCCGELSVPLNPTTFTVSVSRQQVFESTAGIMTPLHNCEVQDYLNWQCTTYWDPSETREVGAATAASWDRYVMSNGSYTIYRSPGLTPLTQALDKLGSNSVYVNGLDWWRGYHRDWWQSKKGIWANKRSYVRAQLDDSICAMKR